MTMNSKSDMVFFFVEMDGQFTRGLVGQHGRFMIPKSDLEFIRC